MSKNDFSVIRTNGPLPDPCGIDLEGMIEELWPAYVDSVGSLLSELELAALSLEQGSNTEENGRKIRRVLHSLKGEAGMCGVMDVHVLCHEAEFGFEELSGPESADMVLKVKDWITAAVDHVSKRGLSPAGQSQDTQAESASSKIRALVIDDDLVCRKGIEMILRDYCDCTFAVNGREGFELFEKQLGTGNPYELVTLDIQMPEMNGHETLEAIRRLEFSREIDGLDGVKVIMTTSQEESGHIFSAFKEGCEAYVVKPAGDKMLEEMAKLGLLKTTTGYAR